MIDILLFLKINNCGELSLIISLAIWKTNNKCDYSSINITKKKKELSQVGMLQLLIIDACKNIKNNDIISYLKCYSRISVFHCLKSILYDNIFTRDQYTVLILKRKLKISGHPHFFWIPCFASLYFKKFEYINCIIFLFKLQC